MLTEFFLTIGHISFLFAGVLASARESGAADEMGDGTAELLPEL